VEVLQRSESVRTHGAASSTDLGGSSIIQESVLKA